MIDHSKILIRNFELDDYDALINLWERSELPHRAKGRDSLENITHELERGCALAMVAELDGDIIGSIWGTHDGRKGWLNRLAVAPEHRQQGIAGMLVNELEDRLDVLGIDIIGVLVEDWNEDSKQVFKKLGYVKHIDILYYSKRKNPEV